MIKYTTLICAGAGAGAETSVYRLQHRLQLRLRLRNPVLHGAQYKVQPLCLSKYRDLAA